MFGARGAARTGPCTCGVSWFEPELDAGRLTKEKHLDFCSACVIHEARERTSVGMFVCKSPSPRTDVAPPCVCGSQQRIPPHPRAEKAGCDSSATTVPSTPWSLGPRPRRWHGACHRARATPTAAMVALPWTRPRPARLERRDSTNLISERDFLSSSSICAFRCFCSAVAPSLDAAHPMAAVCACLAVGCWM